MLYGCTRNSGYVCVMCCVAIVGVCVVVFY